jgi:hypothetical protein
VELREPAQGYRAISRLGEYTCLVVAHSVVSTVRWAWQPARDDRDAHNRAQARRMYRAVVVSSGLGALLSLVATRSAGRPRLACVTGAVVTFIYAVWTVIVGGVVGQFARSIEAQSRRPPG